MTGSATPVSRPSMAIAGGTGQPGDAAPRPLHTLDQARRPARTRRWRAQQVRRAATMPIVGMFGRGGDGCADCEFLPLAVQEDWHAGAQQGRSRRVVAGRPGATLACRGWLPGRLVRRRHSVPSGVRTCLPAVTPLSRSTSLICATWTRSTVVACVLGADVGMYLRVRGGRLRFSTMRLCPMTILLSAVEPDELAPIAQAGLAVGAGSFAQQRLRLSLPAAGETTSAVRARLG